MTTMASAHAKAPAHREPHKLGLRERKKLQTRRAIRRAAYRLFEEQGYDATPVDQIAEAADVSSSTVFRYFPTKEDIVLTDEYDPVLEAGLRARPLDEPVVESLRAVVLQTVRAVMAEDHVELVQRTRLVREVPALRGRTAENTARDVETLAAVLAERTGRAADDLEIRVVTAALMAALQEAMMRWVADGQREDLESLIDRTLNVLARGLAV